MSLVYEDETNQALFQNNCLALTIRKEYQIQTTYKIFNKSLSVGFKSIFSGLVLTILNIFI